MVVISVENIQNADCVTGNTKTKPTEISISVLKALRSEDLEASKPDTHPQGDPKHKIPTTQTLWHEGARADQAGQFFGSHRR